MYDRTGIDRSSSPPRIFGGEQPRLRNFRADWLSPDFAGLLSVSTPSKAVDDGELVGAADEEEGFRLSPGKGIDHTLPGTELRLSRFAFGTASLHHLTSARSRRMLLEAAVAHGFTHFDTAPIYGFGSSERDLAPVLAAAPGLTVATKVGLYPPGGGEQTRAGVLARKVLGK